MTKYTLSQECKVYLTFENQTMQFNILTEYYFNEYKKAFNNIPHPYMMKILSQLEKQYFSHI